MQRLITLLLLSGLAIATGGAVAASEDQTLKNWFDDPFLQVRNGMPDCPIPLGPLTTDAQRRAEAHYRVERGTSCWLAGKCEKPNAYLYDAPIAEAIRQRFVQSPEFEDASLWITVQRRFVIVQGCIAKDEQAMRIEFLISAVPDVERVVLQLRSARDEKPPYPLAPRQAGATDNPATPR